MPIRSIPDIRVTDPNTREVLEAIKEIVEVMVAQRGSNEQDQVVFRGDTDKDSDLVKGVPVDDTDKADGLALTYDATTKGLVYNTPTPGSTLVHAAQHTDGSDDIQSATNAQKGVATAAHIQAIEANTAASHTQGTDTTLGTQTENLDMGNFKAVNAGDATEPLDLVNLVTMINTYGVVLNFWLMPTSLLSDNLTISVTEGTQVIAASAELTSANTFFKSTIADTPTPFVIKNGTIIPIHIQAKTSNVSGYKTITLHAELWRVDSDGTSNPVQIGADTASTAQLTTSKTLYELYITVATETIVAAGSRLWLRIWATVGAGSLSPTVTIYSGDVHDHISIGVSGTVLGRYLQLAGGTMTGDIVMGGTQQVTGLQAPDTNGDAIRATAKITEVLLESATDLKHTAGTDPNDHAQNGDTDLDATFEATFVKKVDTVNVLSDITSAGADIEDAVTKKHASGSDNQDLSGLVEKVAGSSLVADTEIAKIHANTLDHTQGTDAGLDTGGANAVTAAQAKAGYTHSGVAHAPSDANNYTHPNHSGEVTSSADGAQTIATAAVTLAKMANMATASLLGRNTAATGVPEVLSKATVLSLLNVEDGAEVNNISDINATDLTDSGDTTLHDHDGISENTSARHTAGTDTALGAVGTKNPPVDADLALYRNSASSNALVTSTWTQVKAFLKTYFDTIYNKYVHPNHSGDVTSVADGAQTIANKQTMSATAPITLSNTPTVVAAAAPVIAIPAATNAIPGHATAAQITALEANTSARHTQGTDTFLGTMAANIVMDSHKLTGLAVPATAGDSIRATAKITEALLESATDLKHTQGTDTAIGAVSAKNPPIDADLAIYRDSAASNVLVTSTWAQVKAFFKTYFDTIYNLYVHPNHSGEVTSVADGAQTITNKAVTLAKMNDMATASLLGRNTAGNGVPEVLSKATALSLLNVADGADVTGNNAPKAHTASHTNGTDDIQSATAAQKGLATAAQITKLDGLSNKNILINGDFRINQRAYASAAALATTVYGHDRWKAGAAGGDYSFTQLAGPTTITIAADKTLIQVVEDKNVYGGTYTLSWIGTSEARYAVDSPTPSGAYAASPIVITGQTAGTTMSVEFDAGTLGKVQLELSSVATDFEYRDDGTEFTKCQRYYERVTVAEAYSSFALGVVASATQVQSPFKFIKKRSLPTLSYGGSLQLYDGTTGAVVTSTSDSNIDIDHCTFVFYASGGGLDVGRACSIRAENDATAYLSISSEL